MGKEYFGKYRGIVTNNTDPEGLFRIKAKVPAITGEYETGWCLPCLPFPAHEGGAVILPKVNDTVWIEFEQGNLGYPIWTGCWYAKNAKPSDSYSLVGTLKKYTDDQDVSTNATLESSLKSWAEGKFRPR